MGSLTKPEELVQGDGRGQKLWGRTCCLDTSPMNGKDHLQCYLVTGPGLDDMLYIEAWRDHARTMKASVKENQVVEIVNLTIKALGGQSAMAGYKLGCIWASLTGNKS